MSPDKRTCGSINMNDSWIAWPWFCETVEISTPIPRVTSKKRMDPSANVATLPTKGT